MAEQKITFDLQGLAGSPGASRVQRATTRAAAGPTNELLGEITVTGHYDLSPATRDRGARAVLEVDPRALLALEMEDGFLLYTSAEALAEELRALAPGHPPDAPLRLDALRGPGPASRGVGEWVVRALSLVGLDSKSVIDAAVEKAKEQLGDKARELIEQGVSWAGTKALLWAIEERGRLREPGLYRWVCDGGTPTDLTASPDKSTHLHPDWKNWKEEDPILIFVHGTGMSTLASFGALREPDAGPEWSALFEKYRRHIYAFEHRTFSESPIDNALRLARSLPPRARINLVTHSGGGLVGDLLCAAGFDTGLVDRFARDDENLVEADKNDRRQLRALDKELSARSFRVERYVRVASPARGSLLAGSNLDTFLSLLLHLIGLIPVLQVPVYAVAKRIILQIIKSRTDPRLVPGIEALVPSAPLAALIGVAEPKQGAEIAVIAGDIEADGLLKRIGTLLTGYLFFDNLDNDLLVETDSMYGGLARARRGSLFDRGADVTHFRYFANRRTRQGMQAWLTADEPEKLPSFDDGQDTRAPKPAPAAPPSPDRAGGAAPPSVIVVPGFMGSHLAAGAAGRVWLDFAAIARGGLEALRYGTANITPDDLLGVYDDLCIHLGRTYKVRRFAYDWRAPLAAAAARLAAEITVALRETSSPLRIVAHGMGGLVLRTLIKRHRDAWDALIRRGGARVVMLGTPNRGEHAVVAALLGLGDVVRQLARLDVTHSMERLLSLLAESPGVLQLLPQGTVRGERPGALPDDYFATSTWEELKNRNDDPWFGKQLGVVPTPDLLAQAKAAWASLPEDEDLPDLDRIAYVAGANQPTPCGIEMGGQSALAVARTLEGDGRVTHASGLLACLVQQQRVWFADTDHLGLVGDAALLPAVAELLDRGDTTLLPQTSPRMRGGEQAQQLTAQPGPVLYPTPDGLARTVSGGVRPARRRGRTRYTLAVSARAMDLRYVNDPIIVGHYEGDPISGAESQIDQSLVENQLTLRKRLGVYAGLPGSATVVLLEASAEQAKARRQRGAVVIGLGELGELTATALADAVRNGVLRYLLQIIDRQGGQLASGSLPREVGLTTLFLGHNSTTNISIDDSVQSVVRGVLAANRQFADSMDVDLRVTRLEFIELYLDVATSGAYAIRALATRMAGEARTLGARLDAAPTLAVGEGVRQRLEAIAGASYWPRLIVTDPQRSDVECPPECFAPPPRDPRTELCPPECRGAHESEPDTHTLLPTNPKRRAELARALRFVFLSQRARAEATELQRQPGLVETMVECSVRFPTFNPALSRTLFQLLIPHDLKATIRQTETMVLVVDRYTAGMPWELLSADAEPLIKRTAIVRQFASTRFRTDVRSSQGMRAYVVGNPSTRGFYRAFPDPARPDADALEPLPAAEAEGQAVADLLGAAGYEVTRSMDQEGVEVINKLFQSSYRIVHISAHGVFEHGSGDGKRSGVVLSDGLLLTAAEIRQMELVPDVVFLNCCFLGKTEGDDGARGPATPFNRLAYSVARELIDTGVRVVVAAGWAVRDDAARHFAQCFYQYLLLSRMSLGRAAFVARCDTLRDYPETNTWGAFQVYGDPGFVMDPRVGANGPSNDWTPVTPEELLDRLATLRIDAQQPETSSQRRSAKCEKLRSRESKLLASAPRGWWDLPQVLCARAGLASDLEDFEQAITHYRAAVAIEDAHGAVPVRAIEQLANIEARYGQRTDNEALVRLAIERLEALVSAARGTGSGESPPSAEPAVRAGGIGPGDRVNSERCALLGGAYKRLATLQQKKGTPAGDADALNSLERSVAWYARGEGAAGEPGFNPYCALARLGLQAALGVRQRDDVERDVELALRAGEIARDRYAETRDYFDLIMAGDSQRIARLLDGSLAADEKPVPPSARATATERAEPAVQAIVAAYKGLRAELPENPRNWNSVLSEIESLAAIFKLRPTQDGATARVIERLGRIAAILRGREQVAPAGQVPRPPAKIATPPPRGSRQPTSRGPDRRRRP